MTNTYKFDYNYRGQYKTKVIIANSFEKAMDAGELFLEGLNEDLDLLGSETWEEVQDECEKYNIFVDDLIEEFE
jgi:hypothetical protein